MNLFDKRRPTNAELNILVALVEDVGPGEIIRIVGSLVAGNHDSATVGDGLRTACNTVADLIENSITESRP